MTEDERHLSDDEARRLWHRAAELQAEAARRLEERSRSLASGDDGSDGDERPSGYALPDVRAAAVEAGIGEEFVRQALVEMDGAAVARRRPDELADLFLGRRPRNLLVSRVYDRPPAEVYAVLQRVLPSHPFELILQASRGGHPLEGGVLVFEVPRTKGEMGGFAYDVRSWADIEEVQVALRPVGEDGRRTEVAIRAPLDRSRRVNLWIGGGLTACAAAPIGGVAAGLAGAAVAAAGLATGGVVWVAALAGAAGVGVSGGAGAALWRGVWHYMLGRAETALEKVLSSVGVHLDTGGAFGGGGPAWPVLPEGTGVEAEPPDG